MSNVHVLPVDHLTCEQVHRLAGELRDAHTSGADLGSRLPHIHAAAGTFRKLADDLRAAIDWLVSDAPARDLVSTRSEAILRRYVEAAEQLAEMAAAFPNPGPCTGMGDPIAPRTGPSEIRLRPAYASIRMSNAASEFCKIE